MKSKLSNILDKYWEEIADFRKELHKHPELSYSEYDTSDRIALMLNKHRISYKIMCKTGIAALVEGCQGIKTVAIRCDMDALPIEENTGVDFSSSHRGIMHACGHDAHMAIVMGASLVLNELKTELNGNVKFIFQPGEEEGITGGAKLMIDGGVLEDPHVDSILGMHVWPEIGEGMFGVSDGKMMASCDVWEAKIIGKSGHISMPHKSKNPIFVAAQFINAISGIKTQNIDPLENVVFDIGAVHAGTTYGNIIPEQAVLIGNVRVYNHDLRDRIKDELTELLEGYTKSHKIQYMLNYRFGYAPLVNDYITAEAFRYSAKKIVGGSNVIIPKPVMGSEDFGEYLRKIPGAFGWIGIKQSENIPLHNSKFIVDDETIKRGILIYCQAVWDMLKKLA